MKKHVDQIDSGEFNNGFETRELMTREEAWLAISGEKWSAAKSRILTMPDDQADISLGDPGDFLPTGTYFTA